MIFKQALILLSVITLAAGNQSINDAQNKKKNLEQEKKKAMNDLKNEISDISVAIASGIVDREINADDHKELIDSFIDKL